MNVKINCFVCSKTCTDLDRLGLDPMAMICHCDKLFVGFRLDLYTVYHRLVKINVRVYSAMKREKNKYNVQANSEFANAV